MNRKSDVFVDNILLVDICIEPLAEQLIRAGYRIISVPNLAAISTVNESFALMLISESQARAALQTGFESIYFMNNSVPIAVLIEAPALIDEDLARRIRTGTLDCVYLDEITNGIIAARIDRLYLTSHLDKRLLSIQQNIHENLLLRKEIAIREQALAHFREVSANILVSISSGVLVVDRSGAILLINEHAQRYLGLPETVIGINYTAVLATVLQKPVSHLLENRAGHESLPPVKFRSDKSFFLVSGFAMLETDGQFTGVLLLVQDISIQEETTQQLHRAEKLASIGTMLSGIAHELRNPLSIISARCQLMHMSTEAIDGKMLKTFDSIEKQSERCATIVNKLLEFARHSSSAASFLPVSEIISDVLEYAAYHADFGMLSIERTIAPDLIVFGDRHRYIQLFLNLVTNAVDAMAGKGSLTIGAAAEVPGFITVRVGDTGPGINHGMREKIFDPFFTTKEPGKGTGLGLSIAYTIVQESGGKISFESQAGSTTFTVLLPSMKDTARHE